MKRRLFPMIVLLALVSSFVVLSTPAYAGSTTISVSAANASGTPTGIKVVKGQPLTFQASGFWCSGGIKNDGSPSCGGPEGIRLANSGETVDLVLPDKPIGLLIGRIGTWVFPIGSSAQMPAQASGDLFLLMNDRTCCYADNSGQVTATVAISGAPVPDVLLLAPFNNGVTFTVSGAHYGGKGGYYNNRAQDVDGCHIGTAPDHCRNQLFALDIVPDQQSDTIILAPVAGRVDFLPNGKNAGGCIGLVLDDGIHLNVCHFSSWNVSIGTQVKRGQELGIRSTRHVHLSLDDRRQGFPYIPVPFNGSHILEGKSLDPNPNGETVNYRGLQFKVDFGQYDGLTGTSSNTAIP